MLVKISSVFQSTFHNTSPCSRSCSLMYHKFSAGFRIRLGNFFKKQAPHHQDIGIKDVIELWHHWGSPSNNHIIVSIRRFVSDQKEHQAVEGLNIAKDNFVTLGSLPGRGNSSTIVPMLYTRPTWYRHECGLWIISPIRVGKQWEDDMSRPHIIMHVEAVVYRHLSLGDKGDIFVWLKYQIVLLFSWVTRVRKYNWLVSM